MKLKILAAAIAISLISCSTQKNIPMNNPQEWKHNTNIYEVNLRQYSREGTINAFLPNLPRLKKMGVRTLWFMPITPIAQKNKKGSLGSQYACSDYTAVNPEFGTLPDFKNLVNEAHKQGFTVILDWVANHTGWDHIWTKTHPDYYLHDPDGSFHIASGMDDIIELDYKNPQMRQAMVDAMKFWVKETNIDGFRCDLASWVEVDFWQQARPEVEKIKPLFFLGEFDELENPDYGKVFDASYSWSWMHKSEDYFKKNLPLSDLRNLLVKYSEIGDNSQRAWFTTNHDENSWNGTEYEKYGNLAKAFAVFSATWNGIPLLYSGQELPNMKRLQFFEKDVIAWKPTMQMEEFYSKLLHLKTENPALRGGDPAVSTKFLHTDADDKILSYIRKNSKDEVVVLLNLSKETVNFNLNDDAVSGNYAELFEGKSHNLSTAKSFTMKSGDYKVFVKRN